MTEGSEVQITSNIETVIRLGWRMAKAYHAPPPNQLEKEKTGEPLPEHLPGESELSSYEQGQTLVAEIQHDVTILKLAYAFILPSDADLAGIVTPDGDGDSTKQALLTIHRELRRELATQDSHLATGLDLGRMLADTVLLTDLNTPKTLLEEFDHFRLGNAYGWLDDLHSLLPDHASDAVTGSLKKWEGWIASNKGVVPENVRKGFTRTLHHQGELWRRLLCGEKLAIDLLSSSDYKKAGDRVARRFLGLVGSYILNWWYVIALFAAATAGIAYAVVKYAPSGSSTTAALIATAAGSLGISWKTVASTLGRVTTAAEGPLWDTEVKEAIVIAATQLPHLTEAKP
jgi:hypothetical protein